MNPKDEMRSEEDMKPLENKCTVFLCGIPRDHMCDSNGPIIYGGDNVPVTSDREKAGKGYSWGSVTCSVCGTSSMQNSMWRNFE
jgi:hypothetical protein